MNTIVQRLNPPKFEMTFATMITFVRAGAALFGVVWFAFEPSVVATALIGGGMLLDVIDGWFARRFDQATDFGRWIDAVLDKLVLFGAGICLLAYLIARGQVSSLVLVLLIFALDASIARTSVQKERAGIKMKPTKEGKYGMFLRNTALVLMMFYQCVEPKDQVAFILLPAARMSAFFGLLFGFFAWREYARR